MKNNGAAAARGGWEVVKSEGARAGDDDEEVTEPGTGRRGGAVKLTDRDRDVLGLLVLARYMTAQQVHRLCFEGRHLSLAYRRLLKLARGDSGPPFVRKRFFRTYDGSRVAVWAPTPHAVAAASSQAGPLPELPRHDVGAQFLEHTVQMNELLVALWSTPGRCARVHHPCFRWLPSDAVRLAWGEYERRDGRNQLRVIQPDATLELPAQRRRFFLECEMGGHTIAPGPSKPPGATLSKAERYDTFISGLAGLASGQTHYAVRYPDGYSPEVLFLVLSAGRAASINAALAGWRKEQLRGRVASLRALTFEEAAAELRRLAGLAPLAPRPPAGARRREALPAIALSPEDAELLRRYLFESTHAIHRARDAFRALLRADLPEYPRSLDRFEALVGRLSRAAPPS